MDLHHRFNQLLRQTSAEKTFTNETLPCIERAALESSIKMKDDQLASLSSQLSEYANQLSELETKFSTVSEELESRKVQHEKEVTRLQMKFETALGNSRIEAVQIFRKSSEFPKPIERLWSRMVAWHYRSLQEDVQRKIS